MKDAEKISLKHIKSFLVLVLLFIVVFILIDIVSIYGEGVVVVIARYAHYILFFMPIVVGYRAYQIENYCNSSKNYKIFMTGFVVFFSTMFFLFLYLFLNTKVHLWLGGEL